MNRKRILRIAVFLAVTVTACAVTLPFAITPLVNTEQVKTHLAKVLQDKTGIKVRFNQLAFILKPLPGICITDISAQIDPNNQVTIRKAIVELDPARLLELRASVRRITLQTPELFRNKAVLAAGTSPAAPTSLVATIQNGFDALLALVPEDSDHLDIVVTNARSGYFSTMDCRVQMTGQTRTVNLQAQICGILLDTKDIPKLNSAVKGRITRIQIPALRVDLNHDKNTVLSGKLETTSLLAHLEAFKDRCIKAGELDLNFTLLKDRLNARLVPFELFYPQGRIGIDASLAFGNKASKVEFTGEQIDISQARQVCLPLLKGLHTSQTLFDILRAGTAQKIVVGFKGNNPHHLFNAENLFIDGWADSAKVKIPGVPIIADNVSGRAEMKNQVLSVYPKGGHVGKTLITGGNLAIHLEHHHQVPFSGKFPLKLNLAELPAALITLLPQTVLAREMSKISGLSGRADACLELNRTKTDNDLDVKIFAQNIRANGTYRRLPLPIRINNGSFLLDKRKIILAQMSGAIGDSSISDLDAQIDTRNPASMNIKKMAANIILEQAASLIDLFPGAREKLGPVKHFSGIMDIANLRVQGPMFSPNLWQIHMDGQVNNAAVYFSDNAQGISDLSCIFNATPSGIALSQTTGTIKELSWLNKAASPEYIQSIILPLALTRGRFEKQADACLFQGQFLTVSGAKVFFKTTGPAMDKMSLDKIQIEDPEQTHADVTFYKKPDLPRLDFSGKLNKTTLKNMLYPDSYLYRELEKVTGKNALTVSTDNTGNITITADRLNLNPFLSSQGRSDSALPPRPLVKQKQIFIDVNTLDYGKRLYQGVRARATINQPATDIDIIHARLCDINLTGRITINHGKNSPGALTHLFFNIDQAKEVSLSIGCLTGSQSVIKGNYTLEGELSGTAQTLTRVVSKQNGHLEFQAQSGRIYKATLLSRLLSVANILGETDLQQQGFGFKTFTASADIKHSVVHIKKAFIDADNMAIIAQGWADPLNDALDITFLLAPFKTIDTIIKNIPFLNVILNGRLVSFPARAYGKISDPTVVPLHPSAVGKGLLNLLEDLAKTPGRLIEGVKENEKQP